MYYVNWDTIDGAKDRLSISDSELAKILGIKRTAIVYWRTNKRGPVRKGGNDILKRMCEVLSLDINKVITRPDEHRNIQIAEELLSGLLALINVEKTFINSRDMLCKVLSDKEILQIEGQTKQLRQLIGKAYSKLEELNTGVSNEQSNL